jgi:hypothetical protein
MGSVAWPDTEKPSGGIKDRLQCSRSNIELAPYPLPDS